MKKLILLVVVLSLVGGAAYTYTKQSGRPVSAFRTSPIKRGDLTVVISATGTVEPIEVVDVGAQVAGKINTFGLNPDGSGKFIDYGTIVEEGTILAQIDASLYQADVDQASAQLEQAKANVIRSKADLEQMKAKLLQAENNWNRAQELGPSRALSASDYDSYLAAYATAKATLAVGDATVIQTEKAVVQAEASLGRSKTNLEYCTIRSPVKGVIIDRRVNVGQTVVASLSAPSLFLIAKDLRRMQVWASVNEADIGRIHPGQPVRFTVDAYPNTNFVGEVGKIRLNAAMTQNVVTYTVEINTDNSDSKLLPYLTANVQFEVAQRKDVLLAQNAGLRWTPQPSQIALDARPSRENRGKSDGPEAGGRERGGAAPEGGSGGASADRGNSASERPRRGPEGRSGGGAPADRPPNASGREASGRAASHTLWVPDGEFVRPISIREGMTDGVFTEVEGEDLKEGMKVIVGEMARGEATSADDTKNPFTPQLFRRRQ